MTNKSLSGFSPDPLLSQLPNVQLYVVGGAVRDELMGRPSHDRDWVLVGARAEQLEQLGFTPVGADFPVFIHPVTKDEVALARTERKQGRGYKGFVFHASPEVSLEEDLLRRDFTINAMAMSQDGALIDPYHGRRDLAEKTLRHVSQAFAEDPLRVLRLARFLARFADFKTHESTLTLCRELVRQGEMAHLVPERVGAELSRGLGEAEPKRMFDLLAMVGALPVLREGKLFEQILEKGPWESLAQFSEVEQRWALLLGFTLTVAQIQSLSEVIRLPAATRDLAIIVGRIRLAMSKIDLTEEALLALLFDIDVYRKPVRLRDAIHIFTRIGGVNNWLNALSMAAGAVSQGEYKSALRVHMQLSDAQLAEFGAQSVVEQFKRQWVTQILDTMQH